MLLSELLRDVEYSGTIKDIEIKNVTCDSRQVEPGSVFVCVKGGTSDGHEYARAAKRSGASWIVAERDTGIEEQVLVQDSRSAYAIMCANINGRPAEKMKLIGVTGTNGKTTITYLIKHILEASGKKVGLIGTIQNLIGNISLPAKYTTPDPAELHVIFSRMLRAGCEYVVMEVSSQALDQHRVEGCRFETALFTNLTQDHLDYHITMENYLNATFLIGIMNSINHLNWIFSRRGGKRDDAYNLRLGKDVQGGVVKSREYVKHAKFVILYNAGENKVYKSFRVKNTGELSREQIEKQGYINPKHDRYFCYFFDEEISLGDFDIQGIIQSDKEKWKADPKHLEEYAEGKPVFMSGNELIKFRR